MLKKKQKYYTVWIGRHPGVYDTWEKCNEQIFGFKDAVYKSFTTFDQAKIAFEKDSKEFIGSGNIITASQLSLLGSEQPELDSICVDGAWNTKTLAMEYQGVNFRDGKLLFRESFNVGTNNIAEFLGLVHALAYCKNESLSCPIYSDSRTAISWVRKKHAATEMEITEANSHISKIIVRAENWLKYNSYENRILKWETQLWGENPADFGRK